MKLLIPIYFILSSLSVWAQRGLKESIPFEKPPAIDGDVSDWPSEWWLDPDGKFLSNVGNDAENLYFRLKISDDITQTKVGLFGLTLKLNPTGKRKDKVGIKYPVGKDPSELKREQKEEENTKELDIAGRVQRKKDLVKDVEVLELIGLAKQNIVSSRLGLANGIEVILIAQNDGAYVYEAKIPFKAFRFDKSKIQTLGVEFETGKFVQQNKNTTPSSGYGPSYGRPGGRQQQGYYSNYTYNPLSSPGYLSLNIKLK